MQLRPPRERHVILRHLPVCDGDLQGRDYSECKLGLDAQGASGIHAAQRVPGQLPEQEKLPQAPT